MPLRQLGFNLRGPVVGRLVGVPEALGDTRVYTWVVAMEACPSSSWTTRIGPVVEQVRGAAVAQDMGSKAPAEPHPVAVVADDGPRPLTVNRPPLWLRKVSASVRRAHWGRYQRGPPTGAQP